jgi:hypothetical protein
MVVGNQLLYSSSPAHTDACEGGGGGEEAGDRDYFAHTRFSIIELYVRSLEQTKKLGIFTRICSFQ